LVGSFQEIADAIFEYKRIGVTQFLFVGWPDIDEMSLFSRNVLPLVRRREQQDRIRAEPQNRSKACQ
jgi:alkanesulfonate monooxygenase